jgi:hypothetical protein
MEVPTWDSPESILMQFQFFNVTSISWWWCQMNIYVLLPRYILMYNKFNSIWIKIQLWDVIQNKALIGDITK